jgi:hypothetical protein
MFDHRTISFGLPQVSLSFSISSCVPVLGYCVRKLEDSLSLSLSLSLSNTRTLSRSSLCDDYMKCARACPSCLRNL